MKKLLRSIDPIMDGLLRKEYLRQKGCIELIASENFTLSATMEVLGSVLTNKYSEGRPGKRYYGGNQYIDEIEELCQTRALDLYKLNKENWSVNVQPLSGCNANLAAYTAILKPHDRILGLSLHAGGHLSHGFYSGRNKVSTTSVFYESMHYGLKENGFINYQELEEKAKEYYPKLIIAGGSAYPRDWDYGKIHEIAKSIGAYFMMDMSHISGLVATGHQNNPFDYADIVTTTTHKTLRGPRSGMIFSRNEDGLSQKINQAVFPGLQGGPHNNQIGALAVQLHMAAQPEFKEYIDQVCKNAVIMANELTRLGYKLSTDGTDNHLVLIDLKPQKITGSKVELVCDEVNITLNKNAVIGDKNPMNPGGVRIGTPAMTTRGATEEDFIKIANYFDTAVKLGQEIQLKSGPKLADFKNVLHSTEYKVKLETLREEIETWVSTFEFY